MQPVSFMRGKRRTHRQNVMHAATSSRVSKIYRILRNTQPTFEETDDEWMTHGLSETPFKHLVSSALSTVTTTRRTVSACDALYAEVSNFDDIRRMPEEKLIELIKPVAHYNRKAKTLQRMCNMIIEDFGNTIPETKEALLSLPGIGQKCANLMLNYKHDKPVVAVDTHIHRVINRLGIVQAKTHEKSAKQLNDITPGEFKKHAHEWLIAVGMNICKPRNPCCKECPVSPYCDYYRDRA